MRINEFSDDIISSVTREDFIKVGYFPVICGLKDGKLPINDPNSKINSSKLWSVERVVKQTVAIWMFRKLQKENGYIC